MAMYIRPSQPAKSDAVQVEMDGLAHGTGSSIIAAATQIKVFMEMASYCAAKRFPSTV